MILIGKKLLTEFINRHPEVRSVLEAWAAEVEVASWRTPADIKARYSAASFIKDRVIFNIKGNHFRLDAQVNYSAQIVLVRRIGTHAEYDSWTF